MGDINRLLVEQENLLARIKEIESTYEGMDNEHNIKKVSNLNIKKKKLLGQKSDLTCQLSILEKELNVIKDEVNLLSAKSTGIERILEGIKTQRWFFFKNKPEILMDRDTGILWPNLDYFKTDKDENTNFTPGEAEKYVKELKINGYIGWGIPDKTQMIKMIKDKSFPFKEGVYYRIKGIDNWYCFHENKNKIDLDNFGTPGGNNNASLLPCYTKLPSYSYANDISVDNKVFSEVERLHFTLNLFVDNDLQPIFADDDLTSLYKKLYVEKPLLIKELNNLEKKMQGLEQTVLLSSKIDAHSVLVEYDSKAIDQSVIKYHQAIVSITDDLLGKLYYYEQVKSETLNAFNVIGLKLSKKYEDNPNFTEAENKTFQNRQAFFQKHFKLGMSGVRTKLLRIKQQAEDIEERIETIYNGENMIEELAKLEKEERASFNFIVENMVNMIKKALLKIEFFEANKTFAITAIKLWESWSEDYKIFKTTFKDDLKNSCEEDSIESDIYDLWYKEWQKKRFVVEERFLPLIEDGLKGRFLGGKGGDKTPLEKVFASLKEYRDGIDRFYLEERKGIHQKFAFEAGGELQEKFEVESELYKLISTLQHQLQKIIFSFPKSEDRLLLLRWSEVLLDVQIEEVLDFVKDKELSKISQDVLLAFSDLKRKNFEVYISDSKAYVKELKRRDKEYNSLVFRMRKDLMKR